jgi:hypothetical protein
MTALRESMWSPPVRAAVARSGHQPKTNIQRLLQESMWSPLVRAAVARSGHQPKTNKYRG